MILIVILKNKEYLISFQTLLSKKSTRSIIMIIVVVALAGGYYLYDKMRINNLNELIDELNMINDKQRIVSYKYKSKIDNVISLIQPDTMLNYVDKIKLYQDNYIKELNDIKKELKSDKAIEYMDNYIARNNLEIEVILGFINYLESNTKDKDFESLTQDEYESIMDAAGKSVDKITKQIEELETKKEEMEKELSKLLKQKVTLN